MRKPGATVACGICDKEFNVPHSRTLTAKYCSKECYRKADKKPNKVRCSECGTLFKQKKSQEERNKVWGSFCSSECNSSFRSRASLGDKNPNSKGRNFDDSGYRLCVPAAGLGLGLGKIKLHHAIAFAELGIKKLPAQTHIHHRDCNVLNNDKSNLALLTVSDHKWLHKQFGSATLNAIHHNKIPIKDAVSWSDDPDRAFMLLNAGVELQASMKKALTEAGCVVDIAKLAAVKPIRVEFVVVDDLSNTKRGTGGFGSTGA